MCYPVGFCGRRGVLLARGRATGLGRCTFQHPRRRGAGRVVRVRVRSFRFVEELLRRATQALAVGAAWALLARSQARAAAGEPDGGLIGAAQSAANVVSQDASATAETAQWVPVNANVPVAAGSPGAGGDVEQSNDASRLRRLATWAVVDQSAAQDAGNGGGRCGGQQAGVRGRAGRRGHGRDGAGGAGERERAGGRAVPRRPTATMAYFAAVTAEAEARQAGQWWPARGWRRGWSSPTTPPRAPPAGNVAIVGQTVRETAGQPAAGQTHQRPAGSRARQGSRSARGRPGAGRRTRSIRTPTRIPRTVQLVPVTANVPIAIARRETPATWSSPNDASSKAGAENVAIVGQDVDQTQTGGKGDKPHKPNHPSCGCDDKGDKGGHGQARPVGDQRGRSGTPTRAPRPCRSCRST